MYINLSLNHFISTEEELCKHSFLKHKMLVSKVVPATQSTLMLLQTLGNIHIDILKIQGREGVSIQPSP